MIASLTKRMLTEIEPRLLWKLAWNCGWKGMRGVGRFQSRLRQGQTLPAFLFLSVTNDCNLRCQGCWVTPTNPRLSLSLATMDRVISQAKRHGCCFYGILGGEPLLHPELFDLIARHPDCYFQVFTNGTLLTDDLAATMQRLGNVTPLISIEGNEAVSDVRRGGSEVYRRSMQGVEHCRRHRLITGVATSVCQSNLDELVSDSFLDELVGRGVHYLWYYLYRPVGANPCPELALTPEQIVGVRRFLVEARCRAPIILVDAYWDHDGNAVCPAAVGISHLVNPAGDVEPCPVIQFAKENVADDENVIRLVTTSDFLAAFRTLAAETTRGCILLERPEVLLRFLRQEGARDTSGRDSAFDELARLSPQPSHHLPGREIPEKHPLYRFAKKHWFFGFGAYG
ncbi:MAG: radical SAM protein [Armatimonadetes bacterium CG_4_10_14_3_um_filter_66_18]|nr:radical SAM protein [Armatimonadota bacterium]OIP10845.1 MAG: radical SAM protein [Armatimonadetes bacterium CG2_30_66_41]PIU90897.1 MAG: radical SAM protein [Armatimonadetes bacterium CG06_land_8_20_14_3_00_66_21]PIX38088.1 MAG: radical SAM protein [Armatimonadetes bacterium CG_4_8_14_3_um_filter_66_20]PIY41025.1 MAG: radical SAM protein [Armatimonadetes bacterium CG_4_10_14_3_um_filter_66_18]PIZ49867.1 MAG: radical SAM protein [Armatimonadetes bacterium CG_4_10_14_0_8_um_filter_66_14]PJB